MQQAISALFLILFSSAVQANFTLSGQRTLLQFEDDNEHHQIMIGLSISLPVVCVLIIVICIISCAYCCIVKFKMCTPIYDPIQHEHIYENENTEQSYVETQQQIQETNMNAEEIATERHRFVNSILNVEAPPSYLELFDHPFSPSPLPTYDNLYEEILENNELPQLPDYDAVISNSNSNNYMVANDDPSSNLINTNAGGIDSEALEGSQHFESSYLDSEAEAEDTVLENRNVFETIAGRLNRGIKLIRKPMMVVQNNHPLEDDEHAMYEQQTSQGIDNMENMLSHHFQYDDDDDTSPITLT